MRRFIRPSLLLLLLLSIIGCGGGGDSGGQSANLTNAAANPSSTTTTSSATTTTIGAATTTTGAAPTTTAAATTTLGATTTSSVAATTTTVVGGTTTTLAAGALPRLSATPTVLDPAGTAVLGTVTWADGNTGSGGHGAPVGNAGCIDYNNIGTLQYYDRAHISIFRDGQRLAVPRLIGYAVNCLYEINSDNANGVVDMFSISLPYKRLTLGDFFSIWGQPLSRNNVAGIGGPVEFFVEDYGVLSRYAGNPAEIDLVSRRSITIQIGSSLPEIPVYNWDLYNKGH